MCIVEKEVVGIGEYINNWFNLVNGKGNCRGRVGDKLERWSNSREVKM